MMRSMFAITKNFHIIHMTDDLPALDAWYDDVFSVTRFMEQQYSDVLKRHGSLVLVGDLCIEPMQPAFDDHGWDQVAIGRFWQRFGARLHSIAWYTKTRDDVVEIFRALVADDVRIFGGRGDRSPTEPPPGPLFTHPRDTYTQLQFMAYTGGVGGIEDPRFGDAFDAGWWTREHPLHIMGSSHVTIAVRDLERAKHLFVDVLAGRFLHEEERELTATRSGFVALGDDLVLELAEPLGAGGPVAADMEENGESLYSITFRVADLDAAARFLKEQKVGVVDSDGETLMADPATTHGARFGFTTYDIPGDRRPAWAAF
jgi:catechol 2,3-dioxygenase-like lactoylglutathione lyase family enzyme